MDRYFYEGPAQPGANGQAGLYRVSDRKRGSPDAYAASYERAVALCESRDDAELVVAALNASVGQ